MVGVSLDPSKITYKGLSLGDMVQVEDQEGTLREGSIYSISCKANKWKFDLYVAALGQLWRGVDVGIVRHMGGPDAPMVPDLDISNRPRLTPGGKLRKPKPRPKSAKA